AVEAPVLACIAHLESGRANWWNTLLILAVSLGLFWMVGLGNHPWLNIGLVIAVLAFHELGHYFVMRWFGYRNLRMFFIPFFGAVPSRVSWARAFLPGTKSCWAWAFYFFSAYPRHGNWLESLTGCAGLESAPFRPTIRPSRWSRPNGSWRNSRAFRENAPAPK